MVTRPGAPAAALAVLLALGLSNAALADGDRCAADALAAKLHERLKTDGRDDAEIRDILGSGMKRRVMRGRVVEDSGCTADQVDGALKKLEDTVKG